MASLTVIAEDCKLSKVATCLKRNDDQLILNVTSDVANDCLNLLVCDGNRNKLWKKTLNKSQLESMIEPVNPKQYLTDFRKAIDTKQLTIEMENEDVNLCSTDHKIRMTLNAVSDTTKKSEEIASLLYDLANQIDDLNGRLNKETVLKGKDSRSFDNPVASFDSYRKTSQAKPRKREGMCLINPGSKRLKAPQGVCFE